MQLASAKAIEEAACVIGSLEIKVSEEYSGRSMYGSSTAGVVGTKGGIMQAAVYAAYEMGRDGKDDEIDLFVEDIANLRWDNMGHDYIAY